MGRLSLLDTNTVIYILKSRSPAARHPLKSFGADEIACISVITEAELLHGLEKAGGREERRKALTWVLGRLQVLLRGRGEAAAYGRLCAPQEAIGKTLGPLDMQIALEAIALGAILVSNDEAFQYIAESTGVESWATDI